MEIIHSRYLSFSQYLAQLKGCFLDQADIRSNCLKLNCSTQVLIEGSNISSKRSFEPKQNQRHPYFQNHCTFYMAAAAFRTSVYGEKYYAKPSMAGAKSSRWSEDQGIAIVPPPQLQATLPASLRSILLMNSPPDLSSVSLLDNSPLNVCRFSSYTPPNCSWWSA